MKTRAFLLLTALLGLLLAQTGASAQNAPRPGGGGFPRPLADSPRTGNPGASPQLGEAEFKALLEHWADFDADKDRMLAKSEVPELFAALFARADANQDGKLDEKERALAASPAPVARASDGSPRRGPPPRFTPRRPPAPRPSPQP